MSRLDRLLNPDEETLWSGKPDLKAFVLPALTTIPFGLLFIGFFIFLMYGTAFTGAASPFILFGLIFVTIGFAIMIGPFLWQLLRYRNTEYVITDRRIITQTGAIGLDTRFVDFDKIQEVYVKIGILDRLFRTGSLYAMTAGASAFGPPASPYGYAWGGYGFRPSLAALREPYEVQRLFQEAIERSKGARQAGS